MVKQRKVSEAAVKEYADGLTKLWKAGRGKEAVKMKCEHFVAVLRLQHGGEFPVAVNDGTRVQIAIALRKALGEALFNKLAVPAPQRCRQAVSTLPTLAALPQCPRAVVPTDVPTEAELFGRLEQCSGSSAFSLQDDGAQRFSLLRDAEVDVLINELGKRSLGTPRRLTQSQGNGREGCYSTLAPPTEGLRRVEAAARHWIDSHAGPLAKPLGAKTLLLRYGLGGENYAHHDASGDFQALLMLSRPGLDFGGGAFYLADREPPHAKQDFPFTAAGELLIFRGNKGNGLVDYLHGMTTVTAGTAAETRRFAVGFFQ